MLEEAVTASVWVSLGEPELMPESETVCWVAFSLMVTLLKAFSVGG